MADGHVNRWTGITSSGWFVAAAHRPGTCTPIWFPAEQPGSARSPTQSSRCPGFSGTAPLGSGYCSTTRQAQCICASMHVCMCGYVSTQHSHSVVVSEKLSWQLVDECSLQETETRLSDSSAADKDRFKPGWSHSHSYTPLLPILHSIHIWRCWAISARRASWAWHWDWQDSHQRPGMWGWRRRRITQLWKEVCCMSLWSQSFLFWASPSWRQKAERWGCWPWQMKTHWLRQGRPERLQPGWPETWSGQSTGRPQRQASALDHSWGHILNSMQ